MSATFAAWRPQHPERAVAVLMSGGVDSSVTAQLLLARGMEVAGVTMRIPKAREEDRTRPCCGWEAAQVCRQLGIMHFFADTDRLFHDLVIEPFRRDYKIGRTPSPCVDCNTRLKFNAVRAAIREELAVPAIATGHYARIMAGSCGAPGLYPAADMRRDQSYFLYGLRRDDLANTLFPLGELEKETVRKLARDAGLHCADRPDSMELCFAGEDDYRNALGVPAATAAEDSACPCGQAAIASDALKEEGAILDENGRELGRHSGIWNFTPGQRRGLKISAKEPLYVLRLEPERNAVIVGTREKAFAREVAAEQRNLLAPDLLAEGEILGGKIRSVGQPAQCRVTSLKQGRFRVRFEAPVFAPACGQHLVLYAADGQIVAGGVIADKGKQATS